MTETGTAYDTRERTWRHLDFFQYKTYIHARQPRFRCPKHGVHFIPVPWAKEGSGFTLLFEAMCLEMAKSMPMAKVAEQVDEYDTRLWRFVKYYVKEARKAEDFSDVSAIGIDETSKKGHHYITVFMDLERKTVLYATDGKDHTTVDTFVKDFEEHSGQSEKIAIVTCDMSLGFQKGIADNFPSASTVIDKFHIIKHANEAVDAVRKKEVKTNPLLKKTKYIWLKNDENLTKNQLLQKQSLSKKRLKTVRACAMRMTLQEIFDSCSSSSQAKPLLEKLCSWMSRSRLEPMKDFSQLIKNHMQEILNYFDFKYTNAILEGTNNIIQNLKLRARGFKNPQYFGTIIYLVCSKLNFKSIFSGCISLIFDPLKHITHTKQRKALNIYRHRNRKFSVDVFQTFSISERSLGNGFSDKLFERTQYRIQN